MKTYFLALLKKDQLGPHATTVLMRELLDNKRRADTAGTWYLKPFLEHCTAMLKAIPNWREASDVEAFAMVYQLLGAINYYGISAPTLTGIFGAETYAEIDQTFPGQMERLIDAAIDAGPRSTK